MKRIVIKIGSQIILNNEEEKSSGILKKLIEEIVLLKKSGIDFTIVTSGAVALAKYNLSKKNQSLSSSTSSKQALASIGQIFLMEKYSKYFNKYDLNCAQILASKENFNSRVGYLNVRNTLEKLYDLNVVPIINENDVVSTTEIEGKFFGDNDRLSAVVANAVDADLLILFGTMDGLYSENPEKKSTAKLIKNVEIINKEIMSYAKDSENEFGSGGMISKLEAAKICMNSGIKSVIASPYKENIISNIINSHEIGTQFLPSSSKLESKKRWLLTGITENKGSLKIDSGAVNAITQNGASLLPVGVIELEGKFLRGDIILVKDSQDNEVAWGITNYGSGDIKLIKGKGSENIELSVKANHGSELIHRNNLVIINQKK